MPRTGWHRGAALVLLTVWVVTQLGLGEEETVSPEGLMDERVAMMRSFQDALKMVPRPLNLDGASIPEGPEIQFDQHQPRRSKRRVRLPKECVIEAIRGAPEAVVVSRQRSIRPRSTAYL